jgi:multifunctional methyltransferase subunit TRM112
MKLLTLNFLCCARKTCKTNPAAFPLHPKEAELEQVEAEINPLLIQNMLPRLNWDALKTISQEVNRKIPSNSAYQPLVTNFFHLFCCITSD